MKKPLLIISIFFTGFCLEAQTNVDSLFTVWQDEMQADSNRTNSYKNYIWDGFLFSDPDTAIILSQSLLRFGEEHHYEQATVEAYNIIAVSNALQSNYPKALDYFHKSLKISEKNGNRGYCALTIRNIGNIYKDQGDYLKALDYYQRSMKIHEEIGDVAGGSGTISNIGLIYRAQEDYPKALDYYQRSLKIALETGDKRISLNALNNIGLIYSVQDDHLKAMEYFQRCLSIAEEISDELSKSNALSNIGNIYQDQENFSKALEYYQSSLKIGKDIGNKRAIAKSNYNIGITYNLQRDYPKALEYCKKSQQDNEKIGALKTEKEACLCLYDTYKAMGKSNDALIYLEKINVISEHLNMAETGKQLQQMEFQKQVLADSLATEKETRMLEETHQKEVRKKNNTRNILIGSSCLLLAIGGGVYSRLRYVRKSKATLQVEKDRSENLLLNILPADIAAELKEKGRADARDFDLVSILFTDFKGFTAASEKLSAQDLVAEINTCFEAFDGIMGKYNIEKIKTIGDAYMAAGGLPIPTDDSVKNTVQAALEVQDFISNRKAKLDTEGKPGFEMRVGIHTGPVVAGIVGVKKFQYDIWGDTVNTASRMESSGEVGKVNISEATYELLKIDNEFAFESRGKIEAKGKGEIGMYFVSKT